MRISYGLAAAIGILGCATGAGVRELVTPARAQVPFVYQYTVQEGGWGGIEALETGMNRMGQRGWRAVAVIGTNVIFERAYAMPPPPAAPPPQAPASVPPPVTKP